MKVITLKIEDDVYQELKSCLTTKMIVGSFYGVEDQLFAKMIDSIDKEKTELELKFKKDERKKKR